MRYRALDINEDLVLGPGGTFHVNTPAAVGQAVKTRLRLFMGEWFLDHKEGLNMANILGVRTQATRDIEIQQRILGTPGVKAIADYSSSIVNLKTRAFTVNTTIDTIYGVVKINQTEVL